jgi:hypothetical protein
MAKRLDQADAGVPIKGRNSDDRRTYLRFSEAVKTAGLSRILKADLDAERFNFELDEAALAAAEQLDDKLLLVTNPISHRPKSSRVTAPSPTSNAASGCSRAASTSRRSITACPRASARTR